jgi:nucleotide-binding universal stress UspA family protein
MRPFRTILFAADFSENSREAFRLAGSLAIENKTRILVLHVAGPTLASEEPVSMGQPAIQFFNAAGDEVRHESLRRRMREDYSPNHPIDVEYRTSEGDAVAEILGLAGEIGADLIVMGTHGRTVLRRLLFGSVATGVLRGARCPVLILRSHEPRKPAEEIRVILHPADGSDVSEAALRVARSLARDRGARLILLQVLPFEVLFNELAVPVDPEEYRAALERVGRHLDGPDLKYPVETRVSRGDAADEILRTGKEVGADLIVMGTHGRTGLGRLLLGNVAESVLPEADCPVLVVKTPERVPPASDRPEARSVTIF